MKTAFFTLASDDYYYPVGTHVLINTFKRFHPDIDLIVFRQDMIDKVFAEKNINFYMAKPTFAKLLTKKYDRVVNIDADTIILARLDEVLDQDYEVGTVTNFNDYENATLSDIKEEDYLQAGLVASTNKKFWDIWEEANKEAMKYLRQENDVMNMIWYKHPEVMKMKKVVFDKKKNYLGCKSLGREGEFYLEKKRVMCRGEQVKAYHHAKGRPALPKLVVEEMGFPYDVATYMRYLASSGVTEVYGNI